MSKKLFTPGPANVPEIVRIQLSKDIIHHRMIDFHHILDKVNIKLKQVFKTNNDIIILTSSGTGAMESSIVNLFSTGDEVLIINIGFFGERFIELCNVFNLKVHHLDYEWGKSFNLDDVKSIFERNSKIKGVFVTHHETSTGVLNSLKELGEFINTTNALLIVDSISGLVIHDFKFDDWHIDCALASSQKGFLMPPGLAFVALSEKAKSMMKSSNLPKYYWDYKKYIDYLAKGQNPFTPAISLVLALDFALDLVLEKGIDEIAKGKLELRKYLEAKIQQLGFKLFITDEQIKGNALVPVLSPNNEDLNELVNYLDSRHNLSVSLGQGKYHNTMLRIGIISDFNKDDIDDLINKIKEYLDMNKK
ncbi:MAG: serine--pyruvate transaminase [Haloplasmataceae bacterium]|jgi:aspartate aminotransferase-like enzyme|nr:serine--pyruvate transaminase [Haloplasmataceae bacterium]